jgi:hypothetical protein
MQFGTLPFQYLGWHYTLAIKDFAANAGHLLRFIYHFFSLPILLKTFFAPWRRLGEQYRKVFDPGAWFETFILNTLMRLLGMFFRFWLILIGLATLAAASVAAVIVFLLWLILPLAVIVIFLSGVNLLMS